MEYDPLPDRPHGPDDTTLSLRPSPPLAETDHPGRRRRRRRLFIWLVLPLSTVAMAMVVGVVVGAMIQRPEVGNLEHFEHRLITQLHDRGGEVFQTYSRENRILIPENEMPELLAHAIIAAEDANFYRHGGIDLKGVARAAYKNFRAGRTKEGASTITMQLARELFLERKKVWKRKIEEAFLAVELEKKYSKQQILTLYANLVNLGHGNYGMEAAARDYFGKTVQDLTPAEAATLAGIPQRPSHFAIRKNREAVEERRNYVLERMQEEGFLTQLEYEKAVNEPLRPAPRHSRYRLGPYFAEEVRRHLSSTYGTTALYDRGLQVYTTLDPAIQEAAEDALRAGLTSIDHLKGWRGAVDHFEDDGLEERALPSWSGQPIKPDRWYEGIVLASERTTATVRIEDQSYELTARGIEWTRRKRPSDLLKRGDVAWFRFETPVDEKTGEAGEPFLVVEQEPELEGAALVIESATGAIRAMVGGWSFDRNEFNRATQAHRQVGSAFKPFVFGAALENGFTPADTLFDGPAVFVGADNQESYSPRNYHRKYYGITTLRRALQVSINVTSVKLLDLVGPESVIDFARRCGVQSELGPYPSLALGAVDLTPLEMAAGYAAIVNQGIHVEPYLVERVLTADGRVLEEHMPRAHKATDPQEAYVLTRMLKNVATGGTGAGGKWGLAGEPLDLGGKTGTTDAYTDAWFVGFTPRLTILSWVGYDQKRPIGRRMTGAAAALPIWTRILRRGLEEGWIAEGETFKRPPGIVERDIEVSTGLLASPAAIRVVSEVFIEGNEPEKKFDEHWARIIELPWYLQEPFYLPKERERMPSDIRDWTFVQESWENKQKAREEQPPLG